MDLGKSANEGMVNKEVDDNGCDEKAEGRVDSMYPSYHYPCGLKFLLLAL